MAFGTKYRCEFGDILGIDWKIDIQADPDPGSIITLQASGEPMSIEWYGEDNIFDQNIMGSMMSLNVEADSDFSLSALFTSDNLEYKVIVYQGATVFWNGWILANNYQEPYDQAPFTVTITATDGLGLLKEFKFEDLAYTERKITSVVIHDILDLVSITTFTEYVNIHESTMDSGVGDSPLDQSGVDPYLFESQTCYDALSKILKSWSAGIKQDQGVFVIYRYKELKDATMYGRTFTDGTTKSATTKAPVQYLNRTTQASNFWDYEGGTLTMIAQSKILNVNQDLGARESWFLNYDFHFDDFTYVSAWAIEHWDLSTDTIIQPVSASLETSEQNGVWMVDESSDYDHYIYQDLPVRTTTDYLIMEIDCGGWGANATGDLEIELIVTDGVDTYKYGYSYSTGSGSWVETTDPTYTQLVSKTYSPNVTTDTYKFPVDGIPLSGTLQVRLYNALSTGSNVHGIWKKVKIYAVNSSGQAPKGIGYEVLNAINGQIVDMEYYLGDGFGFDNDHLQFMGAINMWDSTDPIPSSRSWHTRGATENKPLIEVIGNELGTQFSRQKQLIDLPLREMHDDEFLSLTGNLQDVLNQTGGNNRVFAISSGLFNVREREWDLVLSELV